MRKINKDFKAGRPEISKEYRLNQEIEHYGFQECSELIEGRWEGFVTLISTKAGYDKRLEEYNNLVG